MAEPLADQVIRKIGEAAQLYHRLIIVAAPAGGGKTATIQEVQERAGAPLINVNLELPRRMLDLTLRQWTVRIKRLLREIVEKAASEVILLDNTEILFVSGNNRPS